MIFTLVSASVSVGEQSLSVVLTESLKIPSRLRVSFVKVACLTPPLGGLFVCRYETRMSPHPETKTCGQSCLQIRHRVYVL
jgi:hypothetical protein